MMRTSWESLCQIARQAFKDGLRQGYNRGVATGIAMQAVLDDTPLPVPDAYDLVVRALIENDGNSAS